MLTLLCCGTAPRNAPAKRQEGHALPAPEGLVGKWYRKAGKLVFKPGSSFFFLKHCIDQMHSPAGWDRLGINVVFIVLLPFQTYLVLCAGSQLGKLILSLAHHVCFPFPKCRVLVR